MIRFDILKTVLPLFIFVCLIMGCQAVFENDETLVGISNTTKQLQEKEKPAEI